MRSRPLASGLFALACRWRDPGDHHDGQHDGSASTERFLARMPPEVRFEGRKVLDLGCGHGATSVLLAQRGAERVVGLDIQDMRPAQGLLELHPELRDRVTFRRIESSTADALRGERFDLVVSKDTFEHVLQPERYLADVWEALEPGGHLLLGFAPLWKSPWGGHINFITRLPWAHLVFPEEVIMERRRRLRPNEDADTFEDILGGLNRMTRARFERLMEGSGLEQEYLRVNASTGARSRLRRAVLAFSARIAELPWVGEYFTFSIHGVWQKPPSPRS